LNETATRVDYRLPGGLTAEELRRALEIASAAPMLAA
jgi:hypothetical protein